MSAVGPVVLCSPPSKRASPFTEYLGLYYVHAYLRKQGVKAVLLDGAGSKPGEFADEIASYHPSAVGITMPTHFLSRQIQLLANAVKKRCQTKIIVGGHFLCFKGIEFLEYAPSIDIAVLGEGEVTMWELLSTFQQGTTELDVAGIAIRTGCDRIRTTMQRGAYGELDSLPFPTRPKKVPAFSIATSRGCYMRCDFCSVWRYAEFLGGPSWRTRSPANVVAEIDSIIKQYPHAGAFSFVDDAFLGGSKASRERALAIADRLAVVSPPVAWSIACRSNEVEEHILYRLKRGGLRSIHLGIESGSEDVLKRFAKGFSVRESEEAVSTVRKLGFSLAPYFIFFEPEMSLDDVAYNIRFLEKLDLARPSMMRVKVVPYPGTSIYERYKRLGLLSEGPMSYDVAFLNQSVGLLSDVFRETFKMALAQEQELLREEFEADIEARCGKLERFIETQRRWKQLSAHCTTVAWRLLECVTGKKQISPYHLQKARENLSIRWARDARN